MDIKGGFEFSEKKEVKTISESERYGKDVEVISAFGRHAQKKSGEVGSTEKGKLSTSAISPKGAENAFEFGEGLGLLSVDSDIMKAYTSHHKRTKETAENIIGGIKNINKEAIIGETRSEGVLAGFFSNDWMDVYMGKFGEERDIILEREWGGRKMSELTSDEQEIVAEKAEEPIITDWLENPESETAKMYSPREAAGDFALMFTHRSGRMAEKLKNHSRVGLLHSGHKMPGEAFLLSGILIDPVNPDNRITKLKDIGGSLGTLEGWQSKTTIDGEGNKEIKISVRGVEYDVDEEAVFELAKEGLGAEKNRKKAKKEEK